MKQLRPVITVFGLLAVVTGLAYPLAMTGVSQALFPDKANGSLIVKGGRIVGSELIGQNFSGPNYFWGRPSATAPMPNNGANSGGSNLGPTNPAAVEAVKARIAALKAAGPVPDGPVPADLVQASASGLDPEITPAAALYQVPRIAKVRNIPIERVKHIVDANTMGHQFGVMGQPRVNVLKLNLALDQLKAD
ncbi:potassium-transporting ATPase subunit KdpC [Paludibacterium paludis]|uniref:Potassium-transporting ATPase KdpC subunit n=1 Tax=Paludibacterium paludis TaxID=1225769 RepID=A0A918NZF7_9NEIS|nr:potassium-transporting ATPase subunit KdpC [Paludibacterium paludis]GGY07707.1 potassium-transporting ATPase KdpC subunit [Paludibacterium paludis]